LKIKIIIVDDHPIVIDGLRSQIETQPDFVVVGETGDGLEVEELVNRLHADVLLLDLSLPGLSGLEVTRRVRKSSPDTQIVILSMYDDTPYVAEALINGAQAYVLKKSVSSELIIAIRSVLAGERFLSPSLSEVAIDDYSRHFHTEELDIFKTLTRREVEVLSLIVEGLTSPKIADRLGVSSRTVEMHRSNLLHKLGVQTTAELVALAVRRDFRVPGAPLI
jgi:DNA-binding NarL/FixJ family response regulator